MIWAMGIFLFAGFVIMSQANTAGPASEGSVGSSSDPDDDPVPAVKDFDEGELDQVAGRESFDPLFQRHGATYRVPWDWLKGICMNESALGQDERVRRGEVSEDGLSYGIMQVTLKTARDYRPGTTVDDLNDPDISVELAARYLRDSIDLFGLVDLRATEWVIKSYNGGREGARRIRDGELTTAARQHAAANMEEYWQRWKRNMARLA